MRRRGMLNDVSLNDKYEDLIFQKIRNKYTLSQELAILRQKDAKPDEFSEYYNYVEQCKIEAKKEVLDGNKNI